MLFKNREDAGEKLAEKLIEHKDREDVLVIALPRGGVVLGRVIADALHAPLDIVVPRKIGSPENDEYAIGAITESGDAVWNEAEKERYGEEILSIIMKKEQKEARRRLEVYRIGLPPRVMNNKTILLVDDGIATGLTMRAAIQTVKAERPKKIIVTVAGGPQDTINMLRGEIDELITLEIPPFFSAVGQLYEDFPQVEDDEVISLLSKQY